MVRGFNANATIMQHLMNDESGQDMIEYVLLSAVLGLGIIACMQQLMRGISSVFTSLESYM